MNLKTLKDFETGYIVSFTPAKNNFEKVCERNSGKIHKVKLCPEPNSYEVKSLNSPLIGDKLVSIQDLKQEAIKWIKEYPVWRAGRLSDLTIEWIKHFFNITEEDLK